MVPKTNQNASETKQANSAFRQLELSDAEESKVCFLAWKYLCCWL